MSVTAFTSLLKRRKTQSGVTWTQIAEASGVSSTSMTSIHSGRHVPRLHVARAIADFLGTAQLYELIAEIRSAPCESCGVMMVGAAGSSSGRARRRFCTPSCRTKGYRDRRKAPTTRALAFDLEVKEHEVFVLRSTLKRFCDACELDGACVTATCEWHEETPHQCAAVGCRVHRAKVRVA